MTAIDREARGIRIALIDSGVDGTHPWLAGAALSHHQVERRGELCTVVDGVSGDQAGHGTACAGIIHRMVQGATLHSISVLGPDGRAARDALLAAIRFVVREKFHVVNLSLGIDVPRSSPLRPADHRSVVELYELADAAYTVGVVLVASGSNASDFRTYPGKFKSLIGVGRGAFADTEALVSEMTLDHEILAPGDEVLAPALGGGERRWTGTSFACPHVAAHVARIRAARPELSVEAIKAALHELALSSPRGNPSVEKQVTDATA